MARATSPHRQGLGAKLALWRALRVRGAQGFSSQREPHSMGQYTRGLQLLAGNFLIAGQVIAAPDKTIWDVPVPAGKGPYALPDDRAGFAWLDDLAAVGDAPARKLGQAWVWAWMARYGRGQGGGWPPDLTGRRLIRWINHAPFLLSGRTPAEAAQFYQSLSAQIVYLARRWPSARPGLPRFEALTGLIYAGLSLEGMAAHVAGLEQQLAAECLREIAKDGGIATRNPEELLEVFTLLTWAAMALGEAGRIVPKGLGQAIEHIAPALRALRHADGALARFHGGDTGAEGQLDQALAVAGVKAAGFTGPALAMGFARLSVGRTSVIVDVASPPNGAAGHMGGAATTAFELTSGRRPMVVSCGNGRPFGLEWWRAGRSTASHSALTIEGSSSSRFLAPGGGKTPPDVMADLAQVADLKQAALPDGLHLSLAHNGYARTHGLTHAREFWLSNDGRKLAGLDRVYAAGSSGKARFATVLSDHWVEGLALTLRFHLHPDVDAKLDLGNTAASLALKSGEIWLFRHDSRAALSLEPSIYFEQGRLHPRETLQIVLSLRLREEDARIGWTLAKAQDTPTAIRDVD